MKLQWCVILICKINCHSLKISPKYKHHRHSHHTFRLRTTASIRYRCSHLEGNFRRMAIRLRWERVREWHIRFRQHISHKVKVMLHYRLYVWNVWRRQELSSPKTIKLIRKNSFSVRRLKSRSLYGFATIMFLSLYFMNGINQCRMRFFILFCPRCCSILPSHTHTHTSPSASLFRCAEWLHMATLFSALDRAGGTTITSNALAAGTHRPYRYVKRWDKWIRLNRRKCEGRHPHTHSSYK